jgi:prepilin-type N-terminal cleavage/methylation domain-containing protein
MFVLRDYSRSTRRTPARAGYTLVELLVVVMIVLILIAAALPVAKNVMDGQRTREASRQLNALLAMARAYAARNNRPFGLWMEYDAPAGEVDPVSPNPTLRQVTRIYLAEVQAPYSGATTSSRGIIRIPQGQSLPEFQPLTVPPVDNDTNSEVDIDTNERGYLWALIEEGEAFLVKFDFKGDWYGCVRGKATNPSPYTDPNRFYYVPGVTSTIQPPGGGNSASPGFRYQILRQPRRVGNPLELSAGTCIDIEYSGFGPTGTQFGAANNRLVLLFEPGGSVKSVSLDGGLGAAPLGTLHFLIGRVEKVAQDVSGVPITADNSNLGDPNNFWVSVGRLNGSITTSNNYPDVDHANHGGDPWGADRAEFLEECRALATGRELTGGQ